MSQKLTITIISPSGALIFVYSNTPAAEPTTQHCVRCHETFFTRDNRDEACVLPEGSTVRHTTSVEDVADGQQFATCNGPPEHCTSLSARIGPSLPPNTGLYGHFIYYPEPDFPDNPKYHCVRCHTYFIARNNCRWACFLSDELDVCHTTSLEEVACEDYIEKCNGPPGDCTATSACIRRSRSTR
ncbi:hypothetical protein M413DRAFT_30640 [Hebeloma cylindrosporum]|uniref:Uncharacterized protein n=1 Tax=Hebeloma cylindrosporum TaxID=76867 RepID=A0A0C3BLX5_HEBCY|nr:hypothetical protein M413DRAFT_30640 [Hebeloma cylindrosporum h7]